MSGPNRLTLLLVLTALLVALGALSLIAGRVWVPLDAWLSPDPRWAIVLELRVPRTILAACIGAALGLSGAALQGYTRNPLADPGVLGVSSMAALGAVIALYFGLSEAGSWIVPVAAIAGAGVGVGALLLLSGGGASVVTFLLAGVVLNLVSGAAIALALSLAPNPFASGEIINWLMGSFADRSFEEVRLALPFVAVGAAVILTTGRALDALTLGEAGARGLGVDLGRVQWVLGLGVGLATGAGVAVSGVIGFIGLVVPHLLRPLVGARPSALLIPSALGGGVVALAGDILVRLTPAAAEVKLGVAMAILGGPFFLATLVSMRRKLA